MRKQELIHLHGLFSEIVTHCNDQGMAFELEEYQEIGTRPTSIQHSKTDHSDAVFTLMNSVTDEIPTEAPQTESAHAD